jgi:hypothetical protein
MKKMKLLLGLLAVALAFGMTVISCEEEKDDEQEQLVQKTIVVTGIPKDYTYGGLELISINNNKAVATNMKNNDKFIFTAITGGKLTADLYEMKNEVKDGENIATITSNPFTGSGDYEIQIVVSNLPSFSELISAVGGGNSYVYAIGGIDNKSIRNKVTTIPFSEFTAD